MLARLRKAQEETEGFTLIELLVVMIIIGILAAIAIPVFLNQRKAARDSAIKSDVRNVATSLESYFTNNQSYAAVTQSGTTVTIGSGTTAETAKSSQGDTLAVTFTGTAGSVGSSTAFCIQGTNAGASHDWVYESDNGGLQSAATTTCPAGTYGLSTPA
jgi:type IV pilus assembly protein PilA